MILPKMFNKTGIAILGIDCAWSAQNASGVVSGIFSRGRFKQERLGFSCSSFLGSSGAEGLSERREVLDRFTEMYASMPRVICVDVPLSYPFQDKRRQCDNAVSRVFGKAHCSTHSVSSLQLKAVKEWNQLLQACGRLCTSKADVESELSGGGCALIEAYPHPAILGLIRIEERLRYKVGRYRKFWPEADPQQRKANLCRCLHQLKDALSREEFDTSFIKIDSGLNLRELKQAEDMLDALVCAWVAVKAMSDEARPVIEDEVSTIWIPTASFQMMRQVSGPVAMK